MDKSWMKLNNVFSPEYIHGLRNFMKLARARKDRLNRVRCPCSKCNNVYFKYVDVVEDHLYENGMDKSYTRWIHHGEAFEPKSVHATNSNQNSDRDVRDREMANVGEVQEILEDYHAATFMDEYENDPFSRDGQHAHQEELSPNHDPPVLVEDTSTSLRPNAKEKEMEKFSRLLKDAQQELYPGCQKYSKLSFIVKLLHLKVTNHWTNKSVDMLLDLLKDVLPGGNVLPKSHYEARSIMRDLGLGYETIHACKNDCVLFWKEFENEKECPECHESRYKYDDGKGKKVPQKVLRYFPLKPRLQRLFMSRKTAEDMQWHKEKRIEQKNVLRHPADSEAWKEFDKKHDWFANDPRNVRLGLASDGFNPFGNMSNAYSMWPVMLMPYNLPPWKCMKEPFLFLSLLIPGPKSPGNDIDVYLQPLIHELRELWENGVETYDAFTGQNFKLHAAVLWTINDFPAYGNLSGWSTKGKLACPTCNKETSFLSLKHGRKICYMSHRRFLPKKHAWRKRKDIDGKQEHRLQPKELSGDDVLRQLESINGVKFGKGPNNKKRKRTAVETRFNREERNCDRSQGQQVGKLSVFGHHVRPLGATNRTYLNLLELNKARWYVLNNCSEIEHYANEHILELEKQSGSNVQQRHEQQFSKWFERRMKILRAQNSPEATDELYSLACGPDPRIKRYTGCIVNGIRFHTKEREKYRKTQNSGVVVKGEHQSEEIDFYGVLTDVFELDYWGGNRVFLFRCDWWDVGNKKTGIHIDNHFTSVNTSRNWYKDDSLVLASQVEQVFYINDTKLGNNWCVVHKTQPRNTFDIPEAEVEMEDEDEGFIGSTEAYQQSEPAEVIGAVQEEVPELPMHRDDVDAYQIDANDVQTDVIGLYQEDGDFISDDEYGGEDDTLAEYCTDNEETLLSDCDSDLD